MRPFDMDKCRTVPRADVEKLLMDSGIDLECEPVAAALAAATHSDGVVKIDTNKSNVLFRVRAPCCTVVHGSGYKMQSSSILRWICVKWPHNCVPEDRVPDSPLCATVKC
jgi:hypothetical protein